ncbi:MAG TPA: hypothetical protein VGK73_26310, partial [Polyangiaceae bacterium]
GNMRGAVSKHSSWIAGSLLTLAACGGGERRQLTAADVEQSEVLPAGYTSAGTARAACGAPPRWGRISGEPVSSFDCTFTRLKQELAEQAASSGANVLAAVRCQGQASGARACSGTLARASHGLDRRRAWADPVREPDLSFELRRDIAVDVEPSRDGFARRARQASEVGEPPSLPVSHLALGSIRARCALPACEADDLRLALRVAAGGLGVSDLVGVSCATFDGERQCLGTLAASELDAETDARAR